MAAALPGERAARFSDLRTRVLSALAAAAVGLTLLWLGGVWTLVLVIAVTAAMAWEWRTITAHCGAAAGLDAALLVAAVAGAALLAQLWSWAAGFGWLALALAAGALADGLARRGAALGWSLLGGVYIGLVGLGFLYLRGLGQHGLLTTLWLFLVVAAADVGGYFAGRLIGGPKLWPRVSPKKTWAGSLGGIALAAVVGLVISGASEGTFYPQVCAVSALAALVSQAGDLAESAMKRHFGVKDSGRILPGHGGALDRFDGVMAATVAVAAVTLVRGQTVLVW